MRIVIDTNVFISGVFFGGFPRRVLDAVIEKKVNAFASLEIIKEYQEIVEEMLNRKQGNLDRSILIPLLQLFSTISPSRKAAACRDPDDNKFLDCARDSKSLYIVSGDKDLLILGSYEGTEIITAREFCDRYLVTSTAD